MHENALAVWEGFYVIVGSSAGALTGLQFVVMTLIADTVALQTRGESISAFGTPNVVHFCAALLVAAILTIPWSGLPPAGIGIFLSGLIGVVYTVVVTRRALRQTGYEPVLEDWVWHSTLPALAYATLLVAGVGLIRNGAGALFFIGPATLLLVFVGIHNAWDTVEYVILLRAKHEQAKKARSAAAPEPEPGRPLIGGDP
jgi:hypothetical protein